MIASVQFNWNDVKTTPARGEEKDTCIMQIMGLCLDKSGSFTSKC